jgi:AcrR family transcriptional regulator
MATSKSTRLPPDERREQLVRLGLELLGHTPPDQVSIEAIARAAGISKGLLYHYFPTKSDFVLAVLRESREQLAARMAPDLSVAMTVGERLDASIDAFLGYVEEHATGFLSIEQTRGSEDPAIAEWLVANRARRVGGMVDFAAALAGAPRAEVESPALLVAIEGWVSSCQGVVVAWLARDKDLGRADVLHLMREGLLAALVAAAGIDGRDAARRMAVAAAALAHPEAPTPAPRVSLA